jgi:hypothetical protein
VNEPVTVEATISHLPPRAARMAAIEVLLADPGALGDDTLFPGHTPGRVTTSPE